MMIGVLLRLQLYRTRTYPGEVRLILASLALTTCLLAQQPVSNYQPITGKQRGEWFVTSTVGFVSLAGGGVISSAWGTMKNAPVEYGPHWEGFGKRYGMRLTGVSTGNAMEASFGAMWGEDPRYYRHGGTFGQRVKHIIVATFTAPGRDGRYRPAYARFIGNVGNNFLSNTWRVESEADASSAAVRCVWGITGKMGANAFAEFWPDVKRKLRRKP
jgi:hypothetical protein